MTEKTSGNGHEAYEPAGGGPWDAVVVGGGAAGLSAALTLGRVRRSVLVIDADEPRNAPSPHAHGLLSRDGIAPRELLRLGREEVAGYGGRIVLDRVSAVRREGGHFTVAAEGGARATARRLLVATGLADGLPDIPGLRERWGRDVLHCPYCHGWEARDSAIGVLGVGPGSAHQALMFRQLSSRVTLFAHTAGAPEPEQAEQLAALGIGVVEGEVAAVEAADDRLAAVRLASGARVPVDHLVVAPRLTARLGLFADLGLAVADHPMGLGAQLATDASGFTGTDGVWAAGNLDDLLAGVPAAVAAGARAAAAINADLIAADTRAAVAAHRAAAFNPEAEAAVSRQVLGERRHGVDSLLPGS